jgi:hypothetical protein
MLQHPGGGSPAELFVIDQEDRLHQLSAGLILLGSNWASHFLALCPKDGQFGDAFFRAMPGKNGSTRPESALVAGKDGW